MARADWSLAPTDRVDRVAQRARGQFANHHPNGSRGNPFKVTDKAAQELLSKTAQELLSKTAQELISKTAQQKFSGTAQLNCSGKLLSNRAQQNSDF